jgi:hypothetical protein
VRGSLKSKVQSPKSKVQGGGLAIGGGRMNFANPHFTEPHWLWLVVAAEATRATPPGRYTSGLYRPGDGAGQYQAEEGAVRGSLKFKVQSPKSKVQGGGLAIGGGV